MDPTSLRRAFRARPGTDGFVRFAGFLENLDRSESRWLYLVVLLERDVIPIVSRCHPDVELDDISSTCFVGAFETWIPEWLEFVHVAAHVRQLLAEDRHAEAIVELTRHPRFTGHRADEADTLWNSRRWHDAVDLFEGTRSARSHFIARARAKIGEAQRKQRRQSKLMTRHCDESLGSPAFGGRHAMMSQSMRAHCGAELDHSSGERTTWRISALPPGHLASQDLVGRLRTMLGAIEGLGPEYARVFKLLLEGFSQRKIAEIEGRHPAAISRRVQSLQAVCRTALLE